MSLDFYLYKTKRVAIFDRNITHNLTTMASKAGIYEALWCPEKINATYARDIIPILKKGFADLLARPEYFKQFDSPNGWGLYVHFLPFVESVLRACEQDPDAEIEVSV